MKKAFLEGLSAAAASVPADADIHRFVGSKNGRDVMVRGQIRVRELVAGLMELYGSAGRA
jgi:hypothetical protein